MQEIESKYNYERNKNREYETENETLKIKNTRYAAEHERGTNLEDQLMRKNDEVNDLKRKILNLESSLNRAENDLKDERNEL